MKKKHYITIFIAFFLITFCFYCVLMAKQDKIEQLERLNQTLLKNCRS